MRAGHAHTVPMTRILALLLAIAASVLLGASPWSAGVAGADTFCTPTGAETVATDKVEYQPYESIQVTGSGYEPLCEVAVRIVRPNGTVVMGDGTSGTGAAVVTTDAAGSFTFTYLRSSSLAGEHIVDVWGQDGNLAAVTLIESF